MTYQWLPYFLCLLVQLYLCTLELWWTYGNNLKLTSDLLLRLNISLKVWFHKTEPLLYTTLNISATLRYIS
jgi:hypothetical protein